MGVNFLNAQKEKESSSGNNNVLTMRVPLVALLPSGQLILLSSVEIGV